jgi:hypothetical protein
MRLQLAVLLALTGCPGGQATTTTTRSAQSAVTGGGHRLLVLELQAQALRVVTDRSVEGPLPRYQGARDDAWRAELIDGEAAGFTTLLPPQDVLRGEFQGEGTVDAHHLRVPTAAFSLRLPREAGTLVLSSLRVALPPGDPRHEGAGEWVELGRVQLGAVP